MMVVLLITAIVAAASAPIVNKKLMVDQAKIGCPWIYTGLDGSIAYNMKNNNNQTAIIGATTKPNQSSKLYIESKSDSPHILLDDITSTGTSNWYESPNAELTSYSRSANLSIAYNKGSVLLNTFPEIQPANSVIIGRNVLSSAGKGPLVSIGYNSKADDGGVAIGVPYQKTVNNQSDVIYTTANKQSVAIGQGAEASGMDSLSLGFNSSATGYGALSIMGKAGGDRSIAIGSLSNASKSVAPNIDNDPNSAIAIGTSAGAAKDRSIAIGAGAQALHKDSVAIGTQAQALHENSVAIGGGAETYTENQIVLGHVNSTIFIPGRLVVGGSSFLGVTQGSGTYVRLRNQAIMGDRESNGSFRELIRDYNSPLAEAPDPKVESMEVLNAPLQVLRTYRDDYLSDRRLKNVGKAFTGGLEEIKKLEVFNYTFKKDKSKTPRVGVMAQDLEKIFPNAVTKGEDGFLRIRMEDMFYAVVNAIKELDKKIDALRNDEILTLKKQINDLEKQNKELLKRIEKIEKKLK